MFPRQTTTPHLYSWVTALLKLNNTVQCIRGMMGGGGGVGRVLKKIWFHQLG